MIRKIQNRMSPYVKISRLIILILISFCFSMIQGGFVSWFIFYALLPFALYALLLVVYPLNKVSIIRELSRTNIRVGDSLEVRVRVKLPLFIPLMYIVIEDELPSKLQLQSKSNKRLLFPIFRRQLSFTYTIPKMVRGEHKLEHFSISNGDSLGLFEKKVQIQFENHVVVYPSYDLLTYRQLQSVYEEGNKTATRVQNRRDVAVISGIRNYIAGDKISWIHWNATARKNELMTKNFEESTSRDVVIILDKTSFDFFEERISFVASLAYTLLQKGVAVSYTNTDELDEPFVFGRGVHHKEKILYALAQEDSNESRKKTQGETHLAFHQVVCIIVTANVSTQLEDMINQSQGNAALTVIVMQQESSEVNNAKLLRKPNKEIAYRYVSPSSYKGGVFG